MAFLIPHISVIHGLETKHSRKVTINVLRFFLTVSWVGLQFVIVVFPDHTHLLFDILHANYVSISLLLLLPGKGPGSYLNVIGPAGLVMMGKNSRVPKLLVKNRLKLYTIWYSCRMAWIRLGQSTG